MAFDPEKLARENIRRLIPYSSARHEFAGDAEVYLDANENAFGSPSSSRLNRYPDPMQLKVKAKIAAIKNVRPDQIFIGNGSDEAIDLLPRIFCEPGRDEIIICPPTYGMYKVAADINNARINEIPLTQDFQLDAPLIKQGISQTTKLIFICSPNNPTGNCMNRDDILNITQSFHGIVVVDEAYIDFSSGDSFSDEIDNYPNLVVLQTMSKAWGLAGARVGMAFANDKIITLFNRAKPPYNISQLAQDAVLDALQYEEKVKDWKIQILAERRGLEVSLAEMEFVQTIYPSDANFLLVRVSDAETVYHTLLKHKIVVRSRSNVRLCEGCLRITVGTPEENKRLVNALKIFGESIVSNGRSNEKSSVY